MSKVQDISGLLLSLLSSTYKTIEERYHEIITHPSSQSCYYVKVHNPKWSLMHSKNIHCVFFKSFISVMRTSFWIIGIQLYIVEMGIGNLHHEPTNFLGVKRLLIMKSSLLRILFLCAHRAWNQSYNVSCHDIAVMKQCSYTL